MKRHMMNRGLITLLVLSLTLVLTACGSSDSSSEQAPKVPGENTGATLRDAIVGSWVATSPSTGTFLDFAADGRFLRNSGATTAQQQYEVANNQSVNLIDQAGRSTITIDQVTGDTMVISKSPWASQPESFQKLVGAKDLRKEILGFWYASGLVGDEGDVNAGTIFAAMLFTPDGKFVGSNGPTTYETWSNSLVVLNTPITRSDGTAVMWVKPLRIRKLAGDEVEVLFLYEQDELEPPHVPKPRSVTFTRLGVNEEVQKRMVGSWKTDSGQEIEFNADDTYQTPADNGAYQVYGDGILLTNVADGDFQLSKLVFGSDDQLEVHDLDVEQSGVIEEFPNFVLTRVR